MNRHRRLAALAVAALLSAFFFAASPLRAQTPDDIEVAPTPGPDWTCGLRNDDLPWLETEGMRKPITAGCRNKAGAVAVAILSDLSRLKSAMTAEQMASDAEDQLPSRWKVKTKLFDVRVLPGTTRTASFSRVIGAGNGATFTAGDLPMVALSMNVPIVYADEHGGAHQVIAVFRIRSPLPHEPAKRNAAIAGLEETIQRWAAATNVKTKNSRLLTSREYEGIRALSSAVPSLPAAPQGEQAPMPADALSHAFTAALTRKASTNDLALLDQTVREAPDTALGSVAAWLQREARRSAYTGSQDRILADMIAAAPERAAEVLSRWITAAASTGDSNALTAAVRIARKQSLTFAQLQGDAVTSLLRAIVVDKRRITLSLEDRDFFALPAADLLQHARPLLNIKTVDAYASAGRGGWKLRRDATVPRNGLLVVNGAALCVLTSDGGKATVREVSNVLNAAEIASQ